MATPIHDELRILRKRLAHTQHSLAELLGCSRRAIHRWENGVSTLRAGTVLLLRQLSKDSSRLGRHGPVHANITFIDLFFGA